MNYSDTPQTEAAELNTLVPHHVSSAFARSLERKLNADLGIFEVQRDTLVKQHADLETLRAALRQCFTSSFDPALVQENAALLYQRVCEINQVVRQALPDEV